MNIHEYQAKELFKRYGIPFHNGIVVRTADEAFKAAQELYDPIRQFAIKAQVHAGGRGKGGGIKMTSDANEVKAFTGKILGKQLVTPQTGPEGKPVDCVLIESTSEIDIEYYASIVLDRSVYKLCLIVSRQGGMDIEEVAHKEPEKIIKQHFDLEQGLSDKDALSAALQLNENKELAEKIAKVFQAMAKLFIEQDCSLIEINPLALMKNGRIIAIDAKINLDDNALYRHQETASWYDPAQEDPREVDARKIDLSYVGLDGNIGCIVNGAGLAMATMDIIKYAGGEPANFLDVGGGANKEKVTAAFKILLRDPKVKAILVNIFGGIMRCDVVAEGILAAMDDLEKSGLDVSKIPLVVRLEGTNVEKGRQILENSSRKIITAASFEEAARKVVGAIA